MEALKRVVRYLKGTANYALHAKGKPTDILNISVDASWHSAPDSKSVTGYVVRIGTFPIAWRTKRQPLVALSSRDAEISAMYSVCGLVSELAPQHLLYPIEILTDSQSEIDTIVAVGNTRSKHFLRSVNFVKDE